MILITLIRIINLTDELNIPVRKTEISIITIKYFYD